MLRCGLSLAAMSAGLENAQGPVRLDGCLGKMVPPDRIELSTSALPRMRSTTELRRHVL